MYCKKCGTEQKQGQKFCPKCGEPFIIADKRQEDTVSLNSAPPSSEQIFSEDKHSQDTPQQPTVKSRLNTKWLVPIYSLIALVGIAIWGWNRLSM